MYKPTIGLEIHVELKTQTKMFCGCLNDSEEKRPNFNICPICMGHPGTLPVINKKAVESVLKLGLALNSQIPPTSKFDRKNYFYPDLPKGYQISQYDKPLVIGGQLNNVKLRRIHLEEDTARLVHGDPSTSLGLPISLVDFNRAGVPLMELVTEPEIKNGEEAVKFARELQLILRYLGISDADMEKGQMRIEANVSVSKNSELGTKVEIKNLNSFRAVGEAIDYEIKRQEDVLKNSETVKHETRGWDENKKKTIHQRVKEETHDYRYFPEPDLPPLDLTDTDFINIAELKNSIPELPMQKRERFEKEFWLKVEQMEVLIEDRNLAEYFENSVSELLEEIKEADAEEKKKAITLLFNYLTSDINGFLSQKRITIKSLNITPENFSDLILLIFRNEISSRVAKDLIAEMHETGSDPRQIITEKGLSQVSDVSEIEDIVKKIISENPKPAEDYKNGQENALQFLIGQTMKASRGKANPKVVKEILEKLLK
ncbi:MAG: Asp-tRNA(Asn)/Glu-tRNA(Gln) amidotransferase subunit GatB [Patescibacteria group bacterium]